MRLHVEDAVLVGIWCAAVHWTVARSTVCRGFWSRARGRLKALLECPACSGFWLGLSAWGLGIRPVPDAHTFVSVGVCGALGLWLTPIFEGILLWGLDMSSLESSTLDQQEETELAPPFPQSPPPPGAVPLQDSPEGPTLPGG